MKKWEPKRETQAEFYKREHEEALLKDVPRMIRSSKEKTGSVGEALRAAVQAK